MRLRGTEEEAHRKASPGCRNAAVQINQLLSASLTAKGPDVGTEMKTICRNLMQPNITAPQQHLKHISEHSASSPPACSADQPPATPAVSHQPHNLKTTVHTAPYYKLQQSCVNSIRLCLVIHHVYGTCECFLKSRCFSSLIIQLFRIEH